MTVNLQFSQLQKDYCRIKTTKIKQIHRPGQ